MYKRYYSNIKFYTIDDQIVPFYVCSVCRQPIDDARTALLVGRPNSYAHIVHKRCPNGGDELQRSLGGPSETPGGAFELESAISMLASNSGDIGAILDAREMEGDDHELCAKTTIFKDAVERLLRTQILLQFDPRSSEWRIENRNAFLEYCSAKWAYVEAMSDALAPEPIVLVGNPFRV